MIFGIFDGTHQAHEKLLHEARAEGDYLIVAVAQDHIVEHLYGRLPLVNFTERFEELKKMDGVDEVVIGSGGPSLGKLIVRYAPDVVVFAANQKLLKEDLVRELPRLGRRPIIRDLEYSEENSSHAGE